MSEIRKFSFTKDGAEEIKRTKYGLNWPVVYIINDDKEVYIGESSNVFYRTKAHLRNEDRKSLKDIHVIYNEKYNKSAILDIEALLIQYMSADNKFLLQNRNSGQSQSHDYYQRQLYINSFEKIWNELRKFNLINNDLNIIKNSDLFKFSPYKTLTADQYEVSHEILFDILLHLEKRKTYVVNGNAGTGKTVLAIYLVKLLIDFINNDYHMEDLENDDEFYTSLSLLRNLKKFEVGLVIPVTSLRHTLKNVFSCVKGLKPSMVIGPNDVAKKEYDLLIVDEAHRLKRRKNLTGYSNFDKTNKKLNLSKNGTELDWILRCSKKQILFYDKNQSVRPSDVTSDFFKNMIYSQNYETYYLRSQLRVQGGEKYIDFIKNILEEKKCIYWNSTNGYDLKIFTNINEMVSEIKNKNDVYGLSRVIAGYSWPWNTKNKSLDEILDKDLFDIEIQGYHYVWNSTLNDWVNSTNSINEVGCIHTIQGYDLNYAGVIIGNEIVYNKNKKQIEIIPENYFDKKGKAGIENIADLKEYIINIYKVLLTRGIRGTYIYICDDNLREHFINCMNLGN